MHCPLRNNYLLLIALLVSIVARSQQHDFSFEQFNTDNGLSHENITSLVKDKDGFLWIGTVNGLNRFDGMSFKVFRNNPADTQSLPANYIAGITLDKKGDMWISTNKGLCRMDTRGRVIQRINVTPAGESSRRNDVLYGEFDSQGTGWFIIDNFLYAIRQDDHSWNRYPLPTQYYHGNMVQVDSKDRIWLTIGRAKYIFDRESKKFRYLLGKDNDHPNSSLLCGWVKEDAKGKLWLATWAESFYSWNEEKQQFERMDSVGMSLTRFEFDSDEQGRPIIWCGGGQYGLMVYDINTKSYYDFKNDPRNKYSHNLGQAIFILKDRQSGIVWVGTEKGLEKYDRFAIRFQRHYIWQNNDRLTNSQYFLPSDFIQDKTDPSGNTYWISVWIGGMFKWNRRQGTTEDVMLPQGLKNEGIYTMIQAKDGNLWIGHGLGVQVLDPRTKKFVRDLDNFFPDPSGSKLVTRLIEDKKGNIWMATYQGLFEWQRDKNQVINWSRLDSELAKGVGALAEDAEGNIWITNNYGLIKIDPENGAFRYFKNRDRKGEKLPEDLLGALMVDRNQDIWVSGVGFLARLNKQGEVKNIFTNREGYFGTSVYNIRQDPQGFIWLGTDYKLHRLNPVTSHFDYFNKDDGLLSNEVSDGLDITGDGELFLGFNGGYCSIKTDKINFNKMAPAIEVSQLLVNGRPRDFDARDHITVNPHERNISIQFAAMNYSQAQKNVYGFIIEGMDTGWKYTTDRTVILMNLEGGVHKIHVKASNNDGVWSEEKVFTIKAIPPFHKTVWFTLLMIAVGGGIIYLIGWYKKQQRKNLEKIRNRIATDLHDDMGSTLSSIRIFSDVAKKNIEEKAPETVPLLERISSNAASLSENMQDIVWTIRNDNDTLEDLVSRMREFGLRVCDARHIRFNVEISKNFRTSKLSLEQRRNLYLIFKETINNAVKYAGCLQIDLLLAQMGRYLKMDISDNGKGFEMDKIKRGNGLNNLEKRATEINGKIAVYSQPGDGTKISLVVLLKKSSLGESRP